MSSKGTKWLLAAVVAAVAALGIWLGGIRIIVIQPIGAIPDGVTAIVAGVRGPNFIDSPDAICNRNMGGVSLFCRAGAAARIVNQGRIIARYPANLTTSEAEWKIFDRGWGSQRLRERNMPIYIVEGYASDGTRTEQRWEGEAPSAMAAAINLANKKLSTGTMPGRAYLRVRSKEMATLDFTCHEVE